MTKCYICEVELNSENYSVEHIIPNAVGGKLKSSNLLCESCNSSTGNEIDAELAKQLNVFSTLIGIKRDRGKVQEIKGTSPDGTPYMLGANAKPIKVKPEQKVIDLENGGKRITISAKDKTQAKEVLKGLKRKYSKIDINKVLGNAEFKDKYIDDYIKFDAQLGGVKFFRAILKIAINYYIHTTGDKKYIKPLIPYLISSEENISDKVFWFYLDDELILKEEGEINHSITVCGDKGQSILYVYIELYNAIKCIVLISDAYLGESFVNTYCFDVINSIELHKVCDIKLQKEQIDYVISNNYYKMTYISKLQKEMAKLMNIICIRNEDIHRTNLINRSIDNSFGKHPDDTPITEEMFNELVKEFQKNLAPYIINRMERKGLE